MGSWLFEDCGTEHGRRSYGAVHIEAVEKSFTPKAAAQDSRSVDE